MKRSKTTLLLFLILSFCYSQTPTFDTENVSTYDSATVYMTYSFWKGFQYVKNGQPQTTGIFYGNLLDELSDVPEARALGKKGTVDFIYAYLTPFVVIPLTALVAVNNIENVLETFAGGYLTSSYISAHFINTGRAKINKAIWIHNREVTRKE